MRISVFFLTISAVVSLTPNFTQSLTVDKACRSFDANKDCEECISTHYLSNKKVCTPLSSSQNVKDCLFYSENKDGVVGCDFCDWGLTVSEKNTCDKCLVDKCAVCRGDGTGCMACFDNLVYDSDEKHCFPMKKFCTKDCSICHSQVFVADNCFVCNKGFMIMLTGGMGSCIKDDGNNCNLFEFETQKCGVCNDFYYLNPDGKCIPTSKNSVSVKSTASHLNF